MGNIHKLNKNEIEILKFRVSRWLSPLSEYQLGIMKELGLAA